MALREELLKRIERKRQEIASMEAQLRDARIYLQALEDTLKMLPREGLSDGGARAESVLRAGSNVAKAHEAIRKAGKPLHIQELLAVIGRPVKPDTRAALSGSLSAYVRRGEVFTRPSPNTFGLVEFEASGRGSGLFPEPPPGFGEDEGRSA